MPLTKRAIKKLRHDKNRSLHNASVIKTLRKLIKTMRNHPTAKALRIVQQALDKAAKRNIVHPNKAARLKSRLSKLLAKK